LIWRKWGELRQAALKQKPLPENLPQTGAALKYKRKLLLFFFRRDNFAAFVMPAIRANRMRQTHFTTITALHQLRCLQTIVRPPAITPTL
jgi:hypothetical protein